MYEPVPMDRAGCRVHACSRESPGRNRLEWGRGCSDPCPSALDLEQAVVAMRYGRVVRDYEFRQRVRAHTPSSLLPLVAAAGARWDGRLSEMLNWPGLKRGEVQKYMPWALAEVARTSLVFGTELNRKPATEDDLLDMLCAYSSLADPQLHRGEPDAAANFFLRISSEQLVYQQSVMNELARTLAMFEQTPVKKSLNVMTPGWAQKLLGCELGAYVGVAFLLLVAAKKNEGRFSLDWFDRPEFYSEEAPVHFDVIRSVTESNFVTDPPRFKALQAAAPEVGGETRRFGFNPLLSKPVIASVAPTVSLIPVPHLIVRKASPLGVYFAGMQRWDVDFSQDVGTFLEAYVGRQLELSGGQVAPAAKYRRSGSDAETVDWTVVFDDVVLLVEVKSVRPTEPVRVADSAAATELTRMLNKAIKQVDTTMQMVMERHPALEHIPNDRPMVGLVVTLEPFHTVNSPLLDRWLAKAAIPVSVCAVADLEHLMQIDDESVGTAVLTAVRDPDKAGWSISNAVGHHGYGRNPVLDAGYEALPWPRDDFHS